jgi:MGT family glycosyltransferase
MAKVLFVNIPAHGHVNPTLPLVSAFNKAGHTVDYLITEDFRKKVEYCGATLVAYYKPININIKKMSEVIKHFPKLIEEMNETMKQLAPRYDVIIAGGMNPSIAKIEKEITTPLIFCSAVFFQNEHTIPHLFNRSKGIPSLICFIVKHPTVRRLFSKMIVSRIFGTQINDVLALFGPQSSTLNIAFTSRYYQPLETTFGNQCLFIGPTPTISIKDDLFPMERLESTNKKIIYASLGTIFNTWTGFFKNVIQAFKDTDYLVVMSTGNKNRVKEIGEIPENFIVRDFVPQSDVLKHSSLFIAHGGFGSISDGMCFGVPMILVPQGADQFFNAYRLKELGAAKVLKKIEVTAETLKSEAELMIGNESFKKGVQKVQESFITAGGPILAVREIEKILAKSKTRNVTAQFHTPHSVSIDL